MGGDGGVDGGVVMAVDIAPEGGDAVDIFVIVCVIKVYAIAAGDDEGVIFEPEAHRGEGMPDELLVAGG